MFSIGELLLPLHRSKRHEIEESLRYICAYYSIQTGSSYTDDFEKNTKNGVAVRYFYVTKPTLFSIRVQGSKIFLSEAVLDFRANFKAVGNKERQQYRYSG